MGEPRRTTLVPELLTALALILAGMFLLAVALEWGQNPVLEAPR